VAVSIVGLRNDHQGIPIRVFEPNGKVYNAVYYAAHGRRPSPSSARILEPCGRE
jgi:hypothetical protein